MKYTKKVPYFKEGNKVGGDTFSAAFQKARKDKLKEFT